MHLKFIARIEVKPLGETSDFFHPLALSKGTGKIELSSKSDDSGLYWTTKVTATLLHDDAMLHEPCIVRVRLTDGYYIVGTTDIPARPEVKEGVLTEFTLDYKSKTKPAMVAKVLFIAPDCE
jgi:hypothetical protein